ncbi:MAG: hypothetical protein FWC44_00545 [Methanomassiliicoccaceae archaeon]|nr:hypothetical protein [Methanomassiliicoccaceae archaeon]
MTFDNIYGWVPNIEGNVCNPAVVKTRIDNADLVCGIGSKVSILNVLCEYAYDVSGTKVTVSNESCGTAEIEILHEGGLCSIKVIENKLNSDKGTKVWIEEVWKGFRMMVDGCSGTVCDCTSMVPIYVDPGQSVHERIAKAFLETIEYEADFANHVVGRIIRDKNKKTPNKWEILWGKANNLQNIAHSNQLYFRRFLDIYKDEFTPERIDELNRKMNAWCDKAKIAYENNMRESEFGYKRASDRLGRNRFYIAAASLAFALLAFILI